MNDEMDLLLVLLLLYRQSKHQKVATVVEPTSLLNANNLKTKLSVLVATITNFDHCSYRRLCCRIYSNNWNKYKYCRLILLLLVVQYNLLTCNIQQYHQLSFPNSVPVVVTAFSLDSISHTSNQRNNNNNNNFQTKLFSSVPDNMVSNQGTDNILAAATTTTTTTPTYDSNQIVKVLGVCGGIGSGKSTVCQLLVSEFGCLAHIGKFL
jgi:hypothetical protein